MNLAELVFALTAPLCMFTEPESRVASLGYCDIAWHLQDAHLCGTYLWLAIVKMQLEHAQPEFTDERVSFADAVAPQSAESSADSAVEKFDLLPNLFDDSKQALVEKPVANAVNTATAAHWCHIHGWVFSRPFLSAGKTIFELSLPSYSHIVRISHSIFRNTALAIGSVRHCAIELEACA